MRHAIVTVGLGLALSACLGGPDIRQLELGIAAGASLGVTSSLAMQAVRSGGGTCAAVQTACATYPCDSSVTLTLGDACPMPIGGAATGTVVVAGTWHSADSATLSSTFTSVAVGGRGNVVTDVQALTANASAGSLTVQFTGQNVRVAGGTALVAQSTWTVRVDDAGTPADPSDDSYTIDSTTQNVGGTSVTQITASGVALTPACRQNPTAGTAIIQRVSLTNISNTNITFHAACDGAASVGSGAVPLHFFQ